MSWPGAFLDALDAGEAMSFRLYAVGAVGAIAASDGAAPLRLARAPLITGWGLQLRAWASSLPVCTLQIACTPAEYQAFVAAYPLGWLMEIRAAYSGGEEVIWRGRTLDYSIGAVPGQTTFQVDIGDLVARSLGPDERTSYAEPLFAGIGQVVAQDARIAAIGFGSVKVGTVRAEYTTTTLAFSPGSTSVVTVADTTPLPLGWDYSSGVALGGAIFERDGRQATVYFGAKTATELQTLSYPQMPGGTPTAPAFPTSYTIGTEVYPVGVVAGHPFDIVRGVWTSTGTGTNGLWDALPATWGLGIPVATLDTPDMSAWALQVYGVSPGAVQLYAIQTREEWPDASPLYAWASAVGVWPVTRQGLLSLRAAVNPNTATSGIIAGAVTDGNLLAIGRHKVRAAGCDAEYNYLAAVHAVYHVVYTSNGEPKPLEITGRSGTTPVTMPAARRTAASQLVEHIIGATGPVIGDLGRRVAPWACRVAMEVEGVEIFGRAVGWVPGDIVTVTSASIPIGGGAVAVDTPALWIPAEVDWETRTARGRLVFLPQQ